MLQEDKYLLVKFGPSSQAIAMVSWTFLRDLASTDQAGKTLYLTMETFFLLL